MQVAPPTEVVTRADLIESSKKMEAPMDVTGIARPREILLDLAGVRLGATLTLPETSVGIVAFAHGSGSSRFSRRNRQVASRLNEEGLATLMLDLLTEEENALDELTREYRFDIPLLGRRMVAAVDWLRSQPQTHRLGIGLFGASTGAAAALIAAAERPQEVRALVSRGGRPDLAGAALKRVRAPTLLIVGGRDPVVLDLNREAARALACPYLIEVVEGATHLFEEPGALNQVAELAADWFLRHLDTLA